MADQDQGNSGNDEQADEAGQDLAEEKFTKEQLLTKLKFAMPSWYPMLKRLTVETDFIPLDEQFISYLTSDGVFLPRSCGGTFDQDFSSSDEDEEYQDDAEPALGHNWDFTELEAEVMKVIDRFDGAVMPKLNWSSPKDATWINTSTTLRCSLVSEIFLMLKTSKNISYDLNILKQLQELQGPDAQCYPVLIRCFVAGRRLLAGCQRDGVTYYSALVESKSQFCRDISKWFETKLRDLLDLDEFVFDCHVSGCGTVTLLDIDEFGGSTDPILYSWDELFELREALVRPDAPSRVFDIRIITEPTGVRPSATMLHGIPSDLRDPQSQSVEALVDVVRDGMHLQRRDDARAEKEGKGAPDVA